MMIRMFATLIVLLLHLSFFTTVVAFQSALVAPTASWTSSCRLRQRHLQRKQRKIWKSSPLYGKDWDKILADEDDDAKYNNGFRAKIPPDMRYNERNCARSRRNFNAMKEAGAPGADVYGCVTTTDEEAVFWFLGKVVHVSDVTLAQCIARQWYLIQQHAANLRPLELFAAATSEILELWCAPLDSEFEVAYNRPDVQFTKMLKDGIDGVNNVKANFVGFQGEVYERGEDGFRTYRFTSDGRPACKEITASPMQEDGVDDDDAETTIPSDEQIEQLMKALEGKDINQVYEEQERRRREGTL
jgi:hypothetical protein